MPTSNMNNAVFFWRTIVGLALTGSVTGLIAWGALGQKVEDHIETPAHGTVNSRIADITVRAARAEAAQAFLTTIVSEMKQQQAEMAEQISEVDKRTIAIQHNQETLLRELRKK